MMGSKSLPWLLISAFGYFIPYALIVAQYTRQYGHKSGTIYDWLKDSLSPQAAFVTVFLWYCSYFTWMVSLFMKLLIPISILFCGQDVSSQLRWLQLPTQFWLSIFAIAAVLLMTFLISRGFQTIVSFLKISSWAMAGLFFLSLVNNLLVIHLQPDQFWANLKNSFAAPTFFAGSGEHFFTQLPFFIFSITAFGGLDTVASLADRTKDSRQRFPKAVIYSTGMIALLYFSGILLWSGAMNLDSLRQLKDTHLGNLMYHLMGSSARQLSSFLDLSPKTTGFIEQIYIRYTAFTMLAAYLSLLSSILYGPLKSLLKGTPTAIWPTRWLQLNRQQMPVRALWLQASLVALTILFLAWNQPFLANLYNQLTYMTNVARAIPYLIVASSFPFFLKKKVVPPEQLLIEPYSINVGFSLSVCCCIFFAIGFQIYEPLRVGDYLNASTLLLGPATFSLFAFWLFKRAEL